MIHLRLRGQAGYLQSFDSPSMRIVTYTILKKTNGAPDLIDLNEDLRSELKRSGLKEGSLLIFVGGSTAGITTFEYEDGLIKDMKDLYEEIAPSSAHYAHNDTWNDGNGFSHVRAALQGPSLTVPFKDGKLLLGTWQQVVLAEFDNRPRSREIIVQFTGI